MATAGHSPKIPKGWEGIILVERSELCEQGNTWGHE